MSKPLDDMEGLFKALADATRLRILAVLLTGARRTLRHPRFRVALFGGATDCATRSSRRAERICPKSSSYQQLLPVSAVEPLAGSIGKEFQWSG